MNDENMEDMDDELLRHATVIPVHALEHDKPSREKIRRAKLIFTREVMADHANPEVLIYGRKLLQYNVGVNEAEEIDPKKDIVIVELDTATIELEYIYAAVSVLKGCTPEDIENQKV